MRAVLWTVVLWSLCGAGVAAAEESPEPARAAEAQVAPQPESAAAEATPAAADEPATAEPTATSSTTKVEEAPPAPKAAEPAPAAAEPARAETAEPTKAPAAKAVPRSPFQGSWQEASADEKALFLEAFGESSRVVQERWDKATPDERKRILRAHPLLGARPMKHRWAAATPEERAAFLEVTPKMVQKIKEAWENATPEQRKLLALEHPYFARKAFHHAWTQATPQEKVAFLVAHPALYGELRARWAGATAWQKQWYARTYPGMESLASSKPWAETATEERALFLEANPGIAEKARDAWQKTQPEMRATLVRKWQGWPLKPYQAQLENAGKTFLSVKTRPAATSTKGTGKPGTRHP
jgi:2-oxo-4-hydroxy-4-carboxy--5-ureidoimidazoline (OHCU) decarboxylase